MATPTTPPTTVSAPEEGGEAVGLEPVLVGVPVAGVDHEEDGLVVVKVEVAEEQTAFVSRSAELRRWVPPLRGNIHLHHGVGLVSVLVVVHQQVKITKTQL